MLALFLAITSVVFLFLTDFWTSHSLDSALAINRQLARVESAISIDSTAEIGETCSSYSAQVDNTGEVAINDFSEMDLLVDYTNSSDSKVATRLIHTTDWTISNISPDTRDSNDWNPGEIATFNFTLPSALKSGAKGTVLIGTPLAVSDSNYFTCG